MSEGPPTLDSLLAGLGEAPSAVAVRRAVRQIREGQLVPTDRRTVRVAVTASHNLDLVGGFLEIELLRAGLAAEVYVSPFGQFRQELLSPGSPLSAFRPDFTFLSVEPAALFGPLVESPLSVNEDRRAELLENGLAELDRLAAVFAPESPSDGAPTGRLVVCNFAPPAASPLGLLDATHPAGLGRLMRLLNDRVARLAERRPRVAVFDFEAWAADIGRGRLADERMRLLARRMIADAHLPSLARGWARVVRAGLGMTRKVLVLDLDDTLWGGIVGEDGPDGVKLGPDAPGNAFVELQGEALNLARRGVLLAVASKNNPADALAVIRDHPHMLLREADFAAMQINWNDKADNLAAMAEELGLGLDSFVFLDDNPRERDSLRAKLPAVLVPELPAEPADRPAFLRRLGVFDTLALTDEDRRRGEMYAVRRQRKILASSAASTGDFLRDMAMRVTIAPADSFTLPRVAQLLTRTNQFNTTARRHTAERVAAMLAATDTPGWRVLTLSLTDRLGDHGLVGAAVIEAGREERRIDVIVMSCRVLGWGVETAFLHRIAADAAAAGVRRLVGEFIPTARNAPAADHFARHGFAEEPVADAAADRDKGLRRWVLDPVARPVEPPAHLVIMSPP
jgi:FkbH-like protein